MSMILLIEDDEVLSETLQYTLTHAGFQVVTARDGVRGLEEARLRHPDLILLDVMLPELDGFSVCRILSQELTIPIVLLTALRDEAHVIAGLEMGANDYITKPFSSGELLARVRALLRWRDRQQLLGGGGELRVGLLRINRQSRRVWLADREVNLSHKEFDLLACLMQSAGMALTRDYLLEQVWGSSFVGSHRTIDVHIRWLREKIEASPSYPVFIQTVRGVGYRFDMEQAAQEV